jgi:hypothetical protein
MNEFLFQHRSPIKVRDVKQNCNEAQFLAALLQIFPMHLSQACDIDFGIVGIRV